MLQRSGYNPDRPNRTRARQVQTPTASDATSEAQNTIRNFTIRRPWTNLNWSIIVKAVLILGFITVLYYGWTAHRYVPLLFHRRSTNTSAFEVVEISGKGKGAIASRDIQQGERLIYEPSLFILPDTINTSPSALIHHHLSLLSSSQRQSFYALSHIAFTPNAPASATSADEVVLSIFQTNAIAAGNGVGIFPLTARLNHACSASFNSVYSWREKEGVLVVHALKSIKRGEELLTTYIDTKKSKSERRRYLEDNYGFGCTCGTCSLPRPQSLESDHRLTRIVSLYARFALWSRGAITGEEAIQIAKAIWSIGEEEGYWSERGRLAADAAHVSAAHWDATATTLWAKLALKWYTWELGGDSEQAEEMRQLIAMPSSHRAWATKVRLAVGGPGLR